MSSQRYERVSANDEEDSPNTPQTSQVPNSIPSSPPPSFRSRASSITSQHILAEDPLISDADRTLADTFDDGSDSDNDMVDHGDDRQRIMRGNPSQSDEERNTSVAGLQPANTQFPGPTPAALDESNRVHSAATNNRFSSANDGVFANLNAKPERGEKIEEQPPTYEQAAADATPPYWETTVLAPGFASGDEVYVDGLPVGSVFSFVWNAMISMSFQLVGFLLTYLLHTTHAAKNGSRAGLGVTLVQYGFYMRSGSGAPNPSTPPDANYNLPPDPNSHDFDPSKMADSAAAVAAAAVAQAQTQAEVSESSGGGLSSVASSEWLAYGLMILGWFILIRAVSDFFKARRHEQLVLAAPDRGLNVPVLAENETAETAA